MCCQRSAASSFYVQLDSKSSKVHTRPQLRREDICLLLKQEVLLCSLSLHLLLHPRALSNSNVDGEDMFFILSEENFNAEELTLAKTLLESEKQVRIRAIRHFPAPFRRNSVEPAHRVTRFPLLL